LATAAHALRSPLNAIQGWAHVLRRSGELTEQQVTALDAIDRNTRAQAQLISDMLDGRQLPPKPAVKLGGARARDAPKSDWTLAGKRIVIVEDDIDGREVLGRILRDARAELHSFSSAADAYDYLAHTQARDQPDLLISDIAMPDEDGYQFIGRVRKMESELSQPHRLVALALTSYARVEDKARALRAGFDAHLAKPIEAQAVIGAIIEALGLKPPAPPAAPAV